MINTYIATRIFHVLRRRCEFRSWDGNYPVQKSEYTAAAAAKRKSRFAAVHCMHGALRRRNLFAADGVYFPNTMRLFGESYSVKYSFAAVSGTEGVSCSIS